MERFLHSPLVCNLMDYGVTAEGFKLVMPLYKCSLATWRDNLPKTLASCLSMQRLYVNIFRQVRFFFDILQFRGFS